MLDLIAPQPDPIANTLPASWDLVVVDFVDAHGESQASDLVVEDMKARDRFGFDKYGVRIQPENGRDNLVDAYQEILDGLVYVRSALYEDWNADLERLYRDFLRQCLHLRKMIAARGTDG